MAFCQISAYEGNISKRFFSSRRKTGQIHFEFNRQIYDIKMIECILSDHRFSEGYRQIWGLPALSSMKKTSIGFRCSSSDEFIISPYTEKKLKLEIFSDPKQKITPSAR